MVAGRPGMAFRPLRPAGCPTQSPDLGVGGPEPTLQAGEVGAALGRKGWGPGP